MITDSTRWSDTADKVFFLNVFEIPVRNAIEIGFEIYFRGPGTWLGQGLQEGTI